LKAILAIQKRWVYQRGSTKGLKVVIKDEVLLTVSCPIFPSILIAKNMLTGSLKNRSIDNLETVHFTYAPLPSGVS
jgi:hypothetical protein